MIKTLKKIGTYMLLAILIGLNLYLPVAAQDNLFSPLKDIKSELERENIAVIDYSTPEGEWGSLTEFWRDVLNDGYDNLKEVAERYQEDFEGEGGIIEMEQQILLLEAKKSQALTSDEVERFDILIAEKTKKLNGKEGKKEQIRNDLKQELEELLPEGMEPFAVDGATLLYQELDFYFTHSKWGRLPLRVIIVLKDKNFKGLDQLYEHFERDLSLLRTEMENTISNYVTEFDLGNSITQTLRMNNDDIELIIDEIRARERSGERQLREVTRGVVNVMRNIMGGLAVIWIIISGIRMIMAQGEESVITEQKRSITYAIVGLIAIILVERIVDILLGAPGEYKVVLAPSEAFNEEVYGIVSYIKAIVGIVAIFFIVISGIQTVFAEGEEETITKQKRAVLWVIIGLVLIAIDEIVVENLYIQPVTQDDQLSVANVTSLIGTIGRIITFLLGFVGIIAFAMLIYGAAMMVINYGDEELVESGKKIIKNALIGIIIVISAFALVATLIGFG